MSEQVPEYDYYDEDKWLDLGADYAHHLARVWMPMRDEKITDLLVRYWGVGKQLDEEEIGILLAALDEENKSLNGVIHQRALARLREKGIV